MLQSNCQSVSPSDNSLTMSVTMKPTGSFNRASYDYDYEEEDKMFFLSAETVDQITGIVWDTYGRVEIYTVISNGSSLEYGVTAENELFPYSKHEAFPNPIVSYRNYPFDKYNASLSFAAYITVNGTYDDPRWGEVARQVSQPVPITVDISSGVVG